MSIFHHVMLDLETFGTRPGSALRSIGAVTFGEREGEIGAEFYRNIDEQSCRDYGLTVDLATLAWWEKQDRAALDALALDPLPLPVVVEEFHQWFIDQRGEYIWCHGANFDEPLWAAAVAACNARLPWKYWNVRCTRTAYHLSAIDARNHTRKGVFHNALDDAKHQAFCLQMAFGRVSALAS